MIEQHLTVDQVASRLSLSRRTVARLIAAGRRSGGRCGLHPVCIVSARAVRIPESAVARFLEKTRV